MVITLPSLITQLNEARERYLDLVSQVQNISDSKNINASENQKIALLTVNYFWDNPKIEQVMDTNVYDHVSAWGGESLLAQTNFRDILCRYGRSDTPMIMSQYGYNHGNAKNWYVSTYDSSRDYADTKVRTNGYVANKSFYPVLFT